MEKESCESCKFFEKSKDGGFCLRYPPQVYGNTYDKSYVSDHIDITTESESAWPDTQPEYWCGEWKQK